LIKPVVKFSLSLNLPGVKTVLGDPHRLSQVINNLVSNAAKFTSQGEISFSARVDEWIKPEPGKGERVKIVFEVSDTGIGMTPQVAEHVFEPFVQVNPSVISFPYVP